MTAQNTYSSGGTTWDTRGYTLALDASGSAIIAPTLYGEVTTIGALATVGAYSSDFALGADIGFSYGETACDQTGAITAFSVNAIVTASCSLSVSPMDFGIIDAAIVAPVDQSATILVSCTNGSGYTVGLGFGNQPVDFGPKGRRMSNGGSTLGYGLYHDTARTFDWGLTGGSVAAGVGTGGDQSLTVYGRIFANQQAVIGVYTDTVVVVVTY